MIWRRKLLGFGVSLAVELRWRGLKWDRFWTVPRWATSGHVNRMGARWRAGLRPACEAVRCGRAGAAQRQRDLARFVALRAGDGVGAHHGAAVDLPEALVVELRQQFAQRGADQVLALGGDDAHVLVGGLEIQHLVDRHQVHRGADRRPGSRAAAAPVPRAGAEAGVARARCAAARSAALAARRRRRRRRRCGRQRAPAAARRSAPAASARPASAGSRPPRVRTPAARTGRRR